ncbi:leucyl/phenylalanyl-tRNA--protein transferase [Pleionea sediminis]|uniref:leucyl/phenylalanyl-tRNA--protein transferase n=1 Tax=Pleionea sediminis TaxID=2569479 RepID=UPI0011864646|nr:leucyl/phenylalanyl-tRNA--protein transferase [Pleionea sediminis]
MTIELPYIERPDDFPPVEQALVAPNGLLAFGSCLSDELLVAAYYQGIFPWFNPGEPVFWWSPNPRAAFFLDDLKPAKSLLKTLRKTRFTVTLNHDFSGVIRHCAEYSKNRPSTWITNEMIKAYENLHQNGVAHSTEVWLDDQLVGGLYGVSMGHLFFGESMFHRATDASKVALFYLAKHCANAGFPLIDCQMPNPHLMRLGAKEVSRREFLRYLYEYRDKKVPLNFWSSQDLTNTYRF